ncbi:efflux RND transporter periplasmic adaptor subunit [Chelatococcus reniformis]|uniref:Efflux transporter periplasmic adaptor subunit n=1 Tax=Chelatococcus reniformis TaxID=1494448 RepID=A0A916U809_9HYPH|nr:HlyD family secretion protein [Chelatococcus reniformis]GGC61441.1 hypothetical protein GCM10010994_20010 [Chelatococcus reniformis]
MHILLSRVFVTLVLVTAAAAAGFFLWRNYVLSPWTRDGRVRANVVEVAPDVAGQVVELKVRDNQRVRKGDVLFVIDQERFRLAVEQAVAAISGRQAERDELNREYQRRTKLSEAAVAAETVEKARAAVLSADAALAQAQVDLGVAKLNLERAQVRSPVNGYVTNLLLDVGDYATAGKAMLAVVDADSFYVLGYFEETKLPAIRLGARASIRLMSFAQPLDGHVEGVARAIVDREATDGLIANVNPTFAWVRLAQRIPVRIAIDHVPEGVELSAGMTATVVVER